MLEVKNLVKVYSTKGGVKVKALDDVSVTFPETGMVFLLGKSGSGKSTLLNIAGGLDRADSGEVIVKGKSSKSFSVSDFDSYRNTCIGFVFQEYNILNEFTIEQNIALALELQHKKNDKKAVNALLEQVDLKGLGKRKPNTLSGGQKQRVAIARALIKEPEIIMADEPTGALDSNTGKQVFETLKKLSETKLVIVVSHDRDFAEIYADRIIELADGKIIDDVSKTYFTPKTVSENVQMVSNDTVAIKNAERITENDVKTIVEMLRKNGGEAIITASKNDLKDVKHACKINDSGAKESFTETTDVKINDYDGRNTKFIRSHLPLSNAMKIGASGMKSKPIRLIFTILLSVVAFIMFGLFSALMFYDKDETFIQSIDDGNVPVLDVVKTYQTTTTYTNADGSSYSYTNENNTKLTDDELNTIKSKFGSAFGAVSFNCSIEINDDSVHNTGEEAKLGEYYSNKIQYASTINAGYSGSAKLGQFPTADEEVCISSYTASVLLAQNNGITDEGKLLNKTVKISGNTYKIVGIFDSNDSALEPYSKYKEVIDSNNKEKYNEDDVTALQTLISDGCYQCVFVSENKFTELSKNSNSNKRDVIQEALDYNYQYRLAYAKYDNGDGNYNYNYSTYLDKSYMAGSSYKTYYIEGKTDISGGETVVSTNVLMYLLQNYRDNNFNKLAEELNMTENSWTINEWINGYNIPENTSDEYYTEYQNFKELTKSGAEYYTLYQLVKINSETITFFAGTENEISGLTISGALERVVYNDYTDAQKDEVYNTVLDKYKSFFASTEFDFNVYYEDYTSDVCQQIDNNTKKLKIVGLCSCYYDVIFLSKNDNTALREISKSHFTEQQDYKYETVTKYIESEDVKYDIIFATYGGKKNELSMFSFEFGEDDSRYSLNNKVIQGMSLVNSMIESMSTVFMWVGIVVGVFAMFLLSNFISTSISYKKKDIGILRAVGARGSDVFKIFFSEAFLIDLICVVLATVGCIVASISINKELASAIGGISIFVFGIKSFAIMIGIAVLSGVVATFLPVFFASKKPPVESIRAL